MGRTDGGTLRPHTTNSGNGDPPGWVAYINSQLDDAGYSNADLARKTGLGDSQISKWRRGTSVPDVASCRRIAQAIGRPLLEVLVAAGHLSPTEARMKAPPPAPPAPESEEAKRLARLQKRLDDPKLPEATKKRIRTLLEIAEDTSRSA